MAVENFKGDVGELKMRASAEPVFDVTDVALDQFYAQGEMSTPFLLMLYDTGRIPFSSRIPRDAFVAFITEAFERFPFFGTFDTHLFILRSIFGEESEILFDVPSPGKLEISVNAITDQAFDAMVRDADGTLHNLITWEGDQIVFRGLSGIDTEEELDLMIQEMVPAGIVPSLSLNFFAKFFWIGEDPEDVFNDMVDHEGNEIIFIEVGA